MFKPPREHTHRLRPLVAPVSVAPVRQIGLLVPLRGYRVSAVSSKRSPLSRVAPVREPWKARSPIGEIGRPGAGGRPLTCGMVYGMRSPGDGCFFCVLGTCITASTRPTGPEAGDDRGRRGCREGRGGPAEKTVHTSDCGASHAM